MKKSELWILGTSLDGNAQWEEKAKKALETASVILGESRKEVDKRLKGISPSIPIFYLDNIQEREKECLKVELIRIRNECGRVALFSDTGMPILFDPGREILEFCKREGFSVRCLPGPTSWGTAMSVSGWAPPFLVVGFLPQKTEDRELEWARLKLQAPHVVVMDTPYRFRKILDEARQCWGGAREVFIAWEIGSKDEKYLWGPLDVILKQVESFGLVKGEFILIIKGKS